MHHALWAAGSNGDGQLGVGHCEDTDTWTHCVAEAGCEFPPPHARVMHVACNRVRSVAWCRDEDGGDSLWVAGTQVDGSVCTGFRALCVEELARAVGVGGRVSVQCVAAAWEAFFVVLRSDGRDTLAAVCTEGADDSFGVTGGSDSACAPWARRIHVPCHSDAGALDARHALDHLPFPPAAAARDALPHPRPSATVSPRPAPSNPERAPAPAAQPPPNPCTPLTEISHVAAGVRHVAACVTFSSRPGEVLGQCIYVWGDARHGQAGHPLPSTTRAVGGLRRCIRREPTPVYSWAGARRVQLSLGMAHTAVGVDGQWAFLGADRGQLPPQDACTVRSNWHTVVCTRGGDKALSAHGADAHAQCRGARAMQARLDACSGAQLNDYTCGSEHTLVRVRTADSPRCGVWGWGWNEHGNLLSGDGADCVDVCEPILLFEGAVSGIWAGYGTSWVAGAKDEVPGC
ncbi:alpha tubulin suppressor [Malassezia sp. CBS 17886]|nr:alpha tubulin suppressor [Malassezia sp. CBS 17886]